MVPDGDGTGRAAGEPAADVLADLVAVVTEAATRIHAEHRRAVTGWTAAASVLGLLGLPAAGRGRHGRSVAITLGLVGALLRAERHRRLAELARPE